MGDLTKNFSRREFACKCGCGLDTIDIPLVQRLQEVRNVAGPIVINSGMRCKAHNGQVGKSSTSSHLKGLAVDIKAAASRKRSQVLNGLLLAGFNRLGIGPTFIHADIDPDKTAYVVWLYG